ncbi:hypothetical protein Hdeb2414_s0014g00434171 [Helianthus debilis subsp. tardiflorus]
MLAIWLDRLSSKRKNRPTHHHRSTIYLRYHQVRPPLLLISIFSVHLLLKKCFLNFIWYLTSHPFQQWVIGRSTVACLVKNVR